VRRVEPGAAPRVAEPAGAARGGWRTRLDGAIDQLARPFDARGSLPTRRELLVVAGLLALAAVALYVRHVVRGGWYYDDWALFGHAELAADGDPLSAADRLLDFGYRPGFSLGLAGLYAVGGTEPTAHLAIGVALVPVQCLLFYAALRAVGFRIVVAGAAAALLLAIPAIDTTRLWVTAFPIWLALSLYLAGVIAAALGLRSTARRPRIAWHGAAMAAYAAAVLTYELVAPLVLLGFLLYLPLGGMRAAAVRCGFDALAVALPLAWMLPRAEDNRPIELTPDHVLDRAGDVLSSAWTAFLNLLPADQVVRSPAGVVLILAAAVGIGLTLRERSRLAESVRTWAAIGAGGCLFAAAGLLPLMPADPYYVIRWTGIGNRLGAVSSLGTILLVMATLVLGTAGLAVLVRRPRWAPALAAIALAVTFGQWAVQEADNQDAWADSWRESERVVAALEAALPPELERGSAVIAFQHPTFILPADVPVFAGSWDLNGAVRLRFDDASLVAQPHGPSIACRGGGVALPWSETNLSGEIPEVVPYGRTWFVSVPEERGYQIAGRADCERRLAALGGG
jgi:hypothetical protein